MTKEMPSMIRVAMKVTNFRHRDSHSPKPMFPQLISSGSGAA